MTYNASMERVRLAPIGVTVFVALAFATPALAAPGNDSFSAPQALTGASGSATGTTIGATKQSGEPNHNGDVGGASIWFTWTAPADGWYRFDTFGSSFDTLLAVYAGTTLTTLQEAASNDDATGSNQSVVDFPATAGTTYSIAVDGFNGPVAGLSSGAVTLNWHSEAPPDDAFAAAFRIAGERSSVRGSNIGATMETGEPVNAANPNLGGASVWYSWIAPTSGHLTLTTAGSGYDTTLGIYTGSSASSLTALASNDDAGANNQTSIVSVDVTAGTTYRISVDGFHGPVVGQLKGNFVLNWRLELPTTDATLVAASDIGSCWTGFDAATGQLVYSFPDAAVATIGEAAYDSGSAADYKCFNDVWGLAKARIHPAPADHDYITAGASGYFNYFGAAAGDPTKGYYSYDLGSWHVVVLNSECDLVGGCGAGSPQESWLKADLAAHPTTCTLAYWHNPLFTSGWVGGQATVASFWRDLYAAGAEIVLDGHSHMYERFAPQSPNLAADPAQGIREFVLGTGGYSHHAYGGPMLANEEIRDNTTFGVLALTLHPSGYDWQFAPIAGSTFTDSGSGSCHGAPGGSTPAPTPSPTPAPSVTDQVQSLVATIDGWHLSDASFTKSLKQKVTDILKDSPCKRTSDLVNFVNGELKKSSSRLTSSQGATLLNGAAAIKKTLGC